MRAILYSFRRIKKDGVFSAPSECICATAARPSSRFPAALPRANRQIFTSLERRPNIAVKELTDADNHLQAVLLHALPNPVEHHFRQRALIELRNDVLVLLAGMDSSVSRCME